MAQNLSSPSQDRTQSGELEAMPGFEAKKILLGMVAGSLVSGVFVYILFGSVSAFLDHPGAAVMTKTATSIALICGAIFGPIITLVFSRRRATKLVGN